MVSLASIRNQGNAVADLKVARVLEDDLLVVPVEITGQGYRRRRYFCNYRVGAASQESHPRWQGDGVSKHVGPGKYMNGSTTEPRDVVERCLYHLVVGADKIGLLLSHGDSQAFFPVGLVAVITIRGSWVGNRWSLVGRSSCAKTESADESADGAEKATAVQ